MRVRLRRVIVAAAMQLAYTRARVRYIAVRVPHFHVMYRGKGQGGRAAGRPSAGLRRACHVRQLPTIVRDVRHGLGVCRRALFCYRYQRATGGRRRGIAPARPKRFRPSGATTAAYAYRTCADRYRVRIVPFPSARRILVFRSFLPCSHTHDLQQ